MRPFFIISPVLSPSPRTIFLLLHRCSKTLRAAAYNVVNTLFLLIRLIILTP
uniref:Uncharacterized protein n=1 Tax=Pectobacterium versatile TaxID=2488639 RepID=A0A855MEL1_9GAMM|nr:hypothetical protein F131LOC_02970 [Pectobacterium versatile]